MTDTSWIGLRHPWERLRWARLHWQNRTGSAKTAKAAAESLGIKENTYSAYERSPDSSKHIPFDHQLAVQFGRKFKINWVWILTGQETPFELTQAQQRALDLLARAPEDAQEEATDMIEALLKRRAS